MTDSDSLLRVIGVSKSFGGIQFLNTGRLQKEHKRSGTAVHDGHLGCRQVNGKIIDAETGQRRHQVLDGRHSDTVFYQRSTECRLPNA